MNIQNISLSLFDRKNIIVLYDTVSNMTVGAFKLLNKTAPGTVKYVQITCTDAGVLSVQTLVVDDDNPLPAAYGLSQTYEFNYTNPSQTAGHDVFFTDAPAAHVVVGVGDIRNITDDNKRAKLHRFKLLNGIVLSSPAENQITVYYKQSSDFDIKNV